MAVDALSICNSALLKIGATAISSLSDNNKKAILCNEHYDKIRKQLLRSHPWNFAKKRASLTEDGTEPLFEWSKQFLLPSDYLRAIKLHEEEEFVIEGNRLLTNQDEALLLYIADIEDTTLFEASFSELLALNLAYELSYTLVQSNSLKQTLQAEISVYLRDVRSYNAQEGTPEEFEADEWINSRL